MERPNFKIVDDLSVAAWIQEELEPWDPIDFNKLAVFVPRGHDAYISVHKGEQIKEDNLCGDTNFEILVGILAQHTSTPSDCYYGLWDGFGWGFEHKEFSYLFEGKKKHFDSWSNKYNYSNLLKLENRSYYLLQGDIKDSLKIGHRLQELFFREEPNLLWPADLNWFLAKEIDFQVYLIGGSKKLISEIESIEGFVCERFNPEWRTNMIYVADSLA